MDFHWYRCSECRRRWSCAEPWRWPPATFPANCWTAAACTDCVASLAESVAELPLPPPASVDGGYHYQRVNRNRVCVPRRGWSRRYRQKWTAGAPCASWKRWSSNRPTRSEIIFNSVWNTFFDLTWDPTVIYRPLDSNNCSNVHSVVLKVNYFLKILSYNFGFLTYDNISSDQSAHKGINKT